MIQMPPLWRCANYSAAFVECEGEMHLCSVVSACYARVEYEYEPLVSVDAAAVQRLTGQDCSTAETKRIEWAARREACSESGASPWSSSSRPLRRFTLTHDEAGSRSPASVPLRMLSPLSTSVATSVTLTGPRVDTRATPVHLSALLMGCFVAVGTTIHAPTGTYVVSQVDAKPNRGPVALVTGGCGIRLNDLGRVAAAHLSAVTDAGGDEEGANRVPAIIGLEAQLDRLQSVFAVARASPGHWFGVLIHGPHGCGVRSVTHRTLALAGQAGGGCDVVAWGPALDASQVWHRSRRSVIVLLIPHCERYFGTMEGGALAEAALTARKLQADVDALRRGADNYRPAVVVVGSTHRLGELAGEAGLADRLFPVTVAVALPHAAERAELLAVVRGVPAAACLAEANALVGRTRAEVLAAGRTGSATYRPPFKPVRWSNIGGLDAVKARLHKALVWPQQQPEVFKRFNLTPPRGVLLYGPPGCAKTTLVKALCSEGYFSLIYLDSATVISAYVGESERQLREVFARAAQQAPCIVFFDEVEVIGARRSAGNGGKDAENARLLSTLLTEMDGFAATQGVCFVGATNVPHLIDDALLRPGRFDYLVHVPLPSREDRARILALHLAKTAAFVDEIAGATEGFSGADLSALCTTALLELGSSSPVEAPSSLHDERWATAFFLAKAREFKRTDYDSPALERFQREHASAM